MIEGTTGGNAPQPVGSMSFCSTLQMPSSVFFFFFFFLCAHHSLNEGGGFAVAMAPELSTRLRNWRQCWGLGGSEPFVVTSRPWSLARYGGCMQHSLHACYLPPTPAGTPAG